MLVAQIRFLAVYSQAASDSTAEPEKFEADIAWGKLSTVIFLACSTAFIFYHTPVQYWTELETVQKYLS
ncbi:MAG: hypothetical protein ACI9C4_000361 [Paraglaciecola sp.]|jgi:hypothetical protein